MSIVLQIFILTMISSSKSLGSDMGIGQRQLGNRWIRQSENSHVAEGSQGERKKQYQQPNFIQQHNTA
jgi:hypothetical protein